VHQRAIAGLETVDPEAEDVRVHDATLVDMDADGTAEVEDDRFL
jgi:hypothetical protein